MRRNLRNAAAGLVAASLVALITARAHAEGFAGFVLDERESTIATVRAVVPGSAAERAGLSSGDQIYRDARTPFTRMGLESTLRALAAGSFVTTYVHHTSLIPRQVQLPITQRPDSEVLLRALLVSSFAPAIVAEPVQGITDTHLPKGRVMLLDFWSRNCAPCRAGMVALSTYSARYGPTGLRVWGITQDSPAQAAAAVSAWGGTYPILSDAPKNAEAKGEERTFARYFISAFPTLVLIDRAGVIREVFVGNPNEDRLRHAIENLLREPVPAEMPTE